MKTEDLKKDLQYLAKQGTLDKTDLNDHLEFCIARGLNTFWCAASWSWSTRPVELTITATETTAGRYLLSDDFRGIRTVRHKLETYGGPITFYPKEQFDQEFPYPGGYDANTPIICTAYHDRSEGANYMMFNRPPVTGTVIYIDMYTTVGSVETVPDGYESGLMASIERFLYKLGSIERSVSQRFFENEVVRLTAIDSPFKGHLVQILQPPTDAVEEEGIRSWFG